MEGDQTKEKSVGGLTGVEGSDKGQGPRQQQPEEVPRAQAASARGAAFKLRESKELTVADWILHPQQTGVFWARHSVEERLMEGYRG